MDVLENAVIEEIVSTETEAFTTDDRVTYKDSTYGIVSKVAYLIGVPKRVFDNEHEAPKIEIYEKLDADKTARIIRLLCMEAPMRRLEREQAEAVVFLGKVGVGIAAENLEKGRFERYDGIFLILDEEDRFEGEVTEVAENLYVTVRFRGSHAEAPAQYEKLVAYIGENKMKISGFSREITMIDYGFTNDVSKFVTEIGIPVERLS